MKILQRAHYQRLEEKRCKRIFQEYAGRRVLDVGCGDGKYLRLLREAGCLATGVDINESQVAALRREGFDVRLPANLSEEMRFDCILMAHVIEHMQPKELTTFMDTYLPHLTDDGRLIVITPLLGKRFYYDPTHVRPYYPQSLWMLIGGLDTPAAFRAQTVCVLEDVYFFNDSWRLREARSFYPVPPFPGQRFCRAFVSLCNHCLAWLHVVSGGRLGVRASWLGCYRRKPAGSERS